MPSTAAAQAVCTVDGPEARAEWRLQEDIQQREQYGFRSDRAYVESLLAKGLRLRRHGNTPTTAAEERYLERRSRLELGAKGERYLRRHPEISGWWDVRDDWPRGPYVAVFVADDPAKHRAAIKGLASFPRVTRVVRVHYSDRERVRVANRIFRDGRALRKAGFTVMVPDYEPGTDRLDVPLVTRRTDHASYFAKRYGAVVKTYVLPTEACVRAAAYEIAPDGLSLTVTWQDGAAKPERIEVDEGPDRVVIGIVERASHGFSTGDPGGSAVVKLAAPLGTRAVYDASDGSRMLQSGPAPGDPECPPLPPPPRFATPLESAIWERNGYGMNVDPAYVQSLLDRGRTFTRPEQRWIRSYKRVVDYRSDVDDYFEHRRADLGGTSVIGDYPATPYVLVRLLRHQAFHERRLKRLSTSPDRLRTKLSTVQRDWFYTLPQHIGDDAGLTDGFFDGYGRAGFYVVVVEGHEETQSVDVTVITARADAAEYFRRLYGPIVNVQVVGDRFECRASYHG